VVGIGKGNEGAVEFCLRNRPVFSFSPEIYKFCEFNRKRLTIAFTKVLGTNQVELHLVFEAIQIHLKRENFDSDLNVAVE
jgi:hypothetical protein